MEDGIWNKYPAAFILQHGVGMGLFFFGSCYWEEGCVSGGVGSSGVRTRVKGKCVIVTELMMESRGGQCADRTLGCMFHTRGTECETTHPCTPCFWNPQVRRVHYGKCQWITSRHLKCGSAPSIWGQLAPYNLRTVKTQQELWQCGVMSRQMKHQYD